MLMCQCAVFFPAASARGGPPAGSSCFLVSHRSLGLQLGLLVFGLPWLRRRPAPVSEGPVHVVFFAGRVGPGFLGEGAHRLGLAAVCPRHRTHSPLPPLRQGGSPWQVRARSVHAGGLSVGTVTVGGPCSARPRPLVR